jgi:mannose-6-phosphate isomerase-like protein (cupin superfamily)
MPELITQPSRVAAAGQPPKLIDEYVGRANTGQDGLSIAHMRSPSGWSEPGQRPEFDEFTIVLRGSLVVESEEDQVTVQAGQGVHTRPGEWVRYSSPGADGAEYISVCVPAFALIPFTGTHSRCRGRQTSTPHQAWIIPAGPCGSAVGRPARRVPGGVGRPRGRPARAGWRPG